MQEVRWKRLPLNSNYAVAYAVKDSDVDVIAAYPITPQTAVVEKISEFIANGELNAEMIHVESEHSALSAAIGAAAVGARTFTATAAQGLELMHEILHIASGLRLPIVMTIATRALSAPISIWCDYSDLMNTRDASWVTLITSSAQEVYDSVIQAYRIAEDPRVLLPVMVAYDGFIMSHTYEPVYVAENPEVIREFVPRRKTWLTLDPDKPITLGPIANPDWYYEIKYQQVVAIEEAYKVVKEVDEEFGRRFGRSYGVVEKYRVEDADIVLLTYGGLFGTVKEAIDAIRKRGINVGGLRLRLWRPFPTEEIVESVKGKKLVIVLDRAISYGARIAGPVALELMSIMYGMSERPEILSVVVGIGQRTVTEEDIAEITALGMKYLEEKRIPNQTIYWGVRS